MAPIEIKLCGDWAIGKKPDDRIKKVDPGKSILVEPSHNAAMVVSCPIEDVDASGNYGRVEISDKSWDFGSSINHPTAHIDVEKDKTLKITKSGRTLAEIRHVPPEK